DDTCAAASAEAAVPPDASPAPPPPPPAGYLAKLVIEAEVGRDQEWEEDALALLLCDERVGCGTRMRGEATFPDPPPVGPLRSLVTWKVAPQAWLPVPEVRTEERNRVHDAIDLMFEAAGWPK